jgi:DNA-directed RNA polymerase specialized sigma24 family protein
VQEAEDAGALEHFLAERGPQLMRTAVLLAGGRQDGEDLMQAALERLLRQGRRIQGNPEGYLRRTLVPRWPILQRGAIRILASTQSTKARARAMPGARQDVAFASDRPAFATSYR